MREVAYIKIGDDEARLRLRHSLPAFARALGLSNIVADRVAIMGCELAQSVDQLIVRICQQHGLSNLSLCSNSGSQIQTNLAQLCEHNENDTHGYQFYSWQLSSEPNLDWQAWKAELETPSMAALMLDLEERAADLEIKNKELEESTRLKSEFLANMSHELRTPMNSIIGFTGRVLKKAGDKLDERQLKNLHTVERNAHHLLGLINDLLDISKVEAGRMELYPEHVELQSLIHEVRDLTNSLWLEKGISFHIEVPKQSLLMYVDRVRLKQVLINLVSNAVKFTEEGAVTITVTLENDTDDDANNIIIAVNDTGMGMQAEDLQFIFEAFRQADGSNTRIHGGTGLGLNITKNFVELMGGYIDVSSVYGKGSTFSVHLPQNEIDKNIPDEPELIEQISKIATSSKAAKALILCIDDNNDVLELFQQCLSDDGYQVICAASGEDGLRIAKELKPAAITLDVQMPHKDGWSVLQELKADPITKDIPVLMATMMDNKALGMKLGAVDFLEKPIVPEKLLQSIKSARLLGENREVLVVDDDDGVRELMQQLFEEAHMNVRMAVDGLDAMAQMHAKTPDLIVLDLMMPHMDGFEVIKTMHKDELLKDIPIIVSTAKSLSRDEIELLESHVSQVIIKGGMALNNMVEQAINELKL